MKRALPILIAMMLILVLDTLAQEQEKLSSDSTGVVKQQRRPLTDQEKRVKQVQYYRRSLGGDSLKAIKVNKVMEEYKTALYRMMEDKSMSAEARKSRMEVLMETKNGKLSELLSPVQQSKLIPTSESTGQGLKKQTP